MLRAVAVLAMGVMLAAGMPAVAQTAPAHDWRVFGMLVHGQGASNDQVMFVDAGGVAPVNATVRRVLLRFAYERPTSLMGIMVSHIDYVQELDCANHTIRLVRSMPYLGGKRIDDLPQTGTAAPLPDNDLGHAGMAACSGDWSQFPAVTGSVQAETAARFAQRALIGRSLPQRSWYVLKTAGARPGRRVSFLDRDSIAAGADGRFEATIAAMNEDGENANRYTLLRARIDCAAKTSEMMMGIPYSLAGEEKRVFIEPMQTRNLEPGSDVDLLASALCLKQWDAKQDADGTLAMLHDAAFP